MCFVDLNTLIICEYHLGLDLLNQPRLACGAGKPLFRSLRSLKVLSLDQHNFSSRVSQISVKFCFVFGGICRANGI